MKKANLILLGSLFFPQVALAHSENDYLGAYPEFFMVIISAISVFIMLRTLSQVKDEIKKIFAAFSLGTTLFLFSWIIKFVGEIIGQDDSALLEILFEAASMATIVVLVASIHYAAKIFTNFKYSLVELNEANNSLLSKRSEMDSINKLLDDMNRETGRKNEELKQVLNDYYELMPEIKKSIKREDLIVRCDKLKAKIDMLNEGLQEGDKASGSK